MACGSVGWRVSVSTSKHEIECICVRVKTADTALALPHPSDASIHKCFRDEVMLADGLLGGAWRDMCTETCTC